MADECEAFASPGPSQAAVGGRFGSWGALVLGAALGVAGLGYVATVHHSLAAQHEIIAQMQQHMEAMHAAVVAQSAMKAESETEFHQGGKFPAKFAVDFVTPLKTQDERGTCWDFATVAVLESSYRQQGVAQGWLQQDEFMAISEQAYGAEVIRLCAGPPGSPQQVACLIPGNEIWKNSTDGGDVTELMYLMNGLKDSIFPNSVCPYIPDPGNDSVCPGLTSESRTANPLSLTIKKMDTYYDAVSVKHALVKDRRAMAISTAMPYITHYYPCIGELASEDQCNPASTAATPAASSSRTRGLTAFHPALGPTHARGSHSLKYWLQEITNWEEASMCPNSYDPENWYQCGNTGEVIDARRHGDPGMNIPLPIKRSATIGGGVESCLSEETELYARVNLQPLHLQCTDPNFCLVSDDYTYFVRNTTQWGDRMLRMCLFEYNTATSDSTELCPAADAGAEDRQQYKAQFGNFYVNNFEVEWHAQSYAANKALYPGLDYSEVEKSTRKQNQYEFVGPFPFARIVDREDLPSV
ncbi:hypothetical protein KRP22_006387 [Phytophthora ramorum]|nr:hypothetical protein KRP22_2481 [Phytophthora ramorum]